MITVVGYGRVSTDDDDQLNSLNNQNRFFKEYIEKNPKWSFGGVYADEGITGTSTAKRVQFKKMIEEALNGNIDLIITKEVSRFARNTVDTLSYVRLLKSKGVGVVFINDNIDSMDGDGEFRLTIMASVAQEESRKTSGRVKWGLKRQMENGFVVGGGPFGYRCKKGVLEIKEDEAVIVKDIFNRYVYEEKGISVIAKELIAEKTPTGGKVKKWRPQTIARILQNEKYVGDLITQKTVITDFLDHKQQINTGQEKQQYFKEHHEPIISRETWDMAREEYSKRSKMAKEKSKYSNRYWCSGKVKCGECGTNCITRTMMLKGGRWRAWQCSRAYTYGKPKAQTQEEPEMKENPEGGNNHKSKEMPETKEQQRGCSNGIINEKILMSCVNFALKHIALDEELYIEIQEEINGLQNCDLNEGKAKILKKEIDALKHKKEQLIDLYLEKKISADELERMKSRYDNSMGELEKSLKKIEKENKAILNSQTSIMLVLTQIKNILSQQQPTVELYGQILENAVLYKNHNLDIYFKYMPIPIRIHYMTAGKGETYRAVCTIRK